MTHQTKRPSFAQLFQSTEKHFTFFSGKGGVGKTTLAAATAVRLAKSGHRVMITSTDPAHSLSDVFDCPIGDDGVWINPNLYALEVDSSARWAKATSMEPATTHKGRRGRFQRLMQDAVQMLGDAPGVDEFMSLEILLEAMHTDQFDQIVFDTAPTGHTLRLMLLPQMLDGWIGKILKLKGMFSRLGRAMRSLVPAQKDAPDLGQEMQSARELILQARELIIDPNRTLFALVTIPEAMSVLETSRTLQYLSEQGINVGMVLANQFQPDSTQCEHCQLRHQIHVTEINRLKELLGSVPLEVIPAKSVVIRGVDALSGLGLEMWS